VCLHVCGLYFCASQGGRVGGASRFEGWLDDMPTAGWGYGALTNNRTADFQALLYGHAATYQSRGTFHSTEQLAWMGEGWYRDFLHWPNPPPNGTGARSPVIGGNQTALEYYANENDVSFCIVSEVLIARMTRWQLVFDDHYRDAANTVWLARGAPRRWFQPVTGGFSVKNAPTFHGRVSFSVATPSAGSSIYTVSPPPVLGDGSTPVTWRLRWPGPLTVDPDCDCKCLCSPGSISLSRTSSIRSRGACAAIRLVCDATPPRLPTVLSSLRRPRHVVASHVHIHLRNVPYLEALS